MKKLELGKETVDDLRGLPDKALKEMMRNTQICPNPGDEGPGSGNDIEIVYEK
jgi:hypothetical protein